MQPLTLFSTRLGWVGLAWHNDAVSRLVFAYSSRGAALDALSAEGGRPVATSGCPDPHVVELLKAYAAGEPVDLGSVAVDIDHLTAFQRRVVKACRQVAYGQTSTYAAVATRAGSPAAARAVGQCMAGNRIPLLVPCHRIVGAGGRLGGFSAPGGIDLKRRLLRLEGAEF